MSVNDLPAIMGTVLIVAGLALVGVSTWSRAEVHAVLVVE
jgi:hypothetical protein